MRGKPSAEWGKLRHGKSNEVESWHPLPGHCADVAACSEALLRYSLLGERLARLAFQDRLSDVQISRLSVLAGLHDIGKFNHGFQAKAARPSVSTAGHVREMLALMHESGLWTRKLVEALSYASMSTWAESERELFSYLTAVVSHHGRPQTKTVFRSALWKISAGVDPFKGISELRKMLQDWYPEAWSESSDKLPSSNYFKHAFYGLVTLADWIGSDEELFPFADDFDISYMEHARHRARNALSLLWLEPHSHFHEFSEKEISFDLILPECKPFPVQEAVMSLDSCHPGSITIIEAETGSGKTEAALLHFLKLFRDGQVDGLYFALPTRTAATQIHKRVTKAVSRVFPDQEERPPVLMAVPGYLRVDDYEGRRLAPFRVLWNDDETERFKYRSWAGERPKRYLAGTIVVGTIDQVLLSSLQVNHSHLRATALMRHLLVVDEVHASDLYMNQLLRVVLDRHLKAGGHTLLMSATLGYETRKQLLGHEAESIDKTLHEAIDEAYPLVSVLSEGAEQQRIPKCNQRDKSVGIRIMNAMKKPEDVAELAIGLASEGGSIIIIRNTVSSCLATQREVERVAHDVGNESLLFNIEGSFVPHHSRFARSDRELLDNELEIQFGKNRSYSGKVVVATQTVQQSLDLDADLMITDLCPMDVLLQRIGRLHRHAYRERPDRFRKPRIVVLVPEERNMTAFLQNKRGEARGPNGLGTVYKDLRIIEATWRELEKRELIEIPNDNRRLVESSLHSEVLTSITEKMGGPWVRHQQHVAGVICADKLVADLNISNWSADFLMRDKILFSGSSEKHISTRLGGGDRLVSFNPAVSGPFRKSVGELTIPFWLAEEVQPDETPVDVLSENGVLTFRFGRKKYVYDRLGLQLSEIP